MIEIKGRPRMGDTEFRHAVTLNMDHATFKNWLAAYGRVWERP